MSEQNEPKKFKVIDSRRFDEFGNNRESAEAGSEPSPAESRRSSMAKTAESRPPEPPPARAPVNTKQSAPQNNVAAQPAAPSDYEQQGAEEGDEAIEFSSFIMSLATQALLQMGAMEPPEGMDVPVDKIAARHTIDILAMLARKTAGNLDQNEARLIEEILHTLKLNFIKAG